MNINKIRNFINIKKEKKLIKDGFKYVLKGYTNLSANLLFTYTNFLKNSSNFKSLMNVDSEKLLKVSDDNRWFSQLSIINDTSHIIITVSKNTNKIRINIWNNLLNLEFLNKYVTNELLFDSEICKKYIVNNSYESNKDLIHNIVELICINALYTLKYV